MDDTDFKLRRAGVSTRDYLRPTVHTAIDNKTRATSPKYLSATGRAGRRDTYQERV